MRQITSIQEIPDFQGYLKEIDTNVYNLTKAGFKQPYFVELGPGKHAVALPERVCIDLNEHAAPGCEIYWDLEHGIPLPPSSVHKIHSNQFLEHIHNIILLFNEMWRILIPGGVMWHCVPSWLGPHSWGDPTHVRAFTSTSFQYFCQENDGESFVNRFSSYGIKCDFVLDELKIREKLDITVTMRKPE